MRSKLLSPRLHVSDAVALHTSNREPGRSRALALAFIVFGGVALVTIIIALNAQSLVHRLSMLALSAVMITLIPYVLALSGSVQPGKVRVKDGGALAFVPPMSTTLFPLALCLFGLVPAALAFALPGHANEIFAQRTSLIAGVVLTGASLLWLVQLVWGMRLPRGLSLTRWGLEGVRGGPQLRLPWDFIESVSVLQGSRGPKLKVTDVDGRALLVEGAHIGSDPNSVAAIIEHYRLHPEDESRLASALDAIRCVEDAHRLGRD